MDGHINSGGQLVVDSHAPQIMQDEVKIMIYAISYTYNLYKAPHHPRHHLHQSPNH
jgi:hypothetical protein